MYKYALLYPERSIIDASGYSYYRKNKKIAPSNKVKTLKEWRKINKTIWEEIGKAIIESDGGVQVEGIGYFAVWMNPNKQKEYFNTKDGISLGYNDHTDHHTYHLSVFPRLGGLKSLCSWSMDRTFNRSITRPISSNLKKGKKYYFKYSLVKKLFRTRGQLLQK